jgi:hypothetical protein
MDKSLSCLAESDDFIRRDFMKDPYSRMAVGMAVGTGVGSVLGVLFDDMAVWIGIGLAVGAGAAYAWPEGPDE